MPVNDDRETLILRLEKEAIDARSLRLQLDHELAVARAVAETTARQLKHTRDELELTRETLTQVRVELRAALRARPTDRAGECARCGNVECSCLGGPLYPLAKR
jgi:CRP-like cAMP-binding protein